MCVSESLVMISSPLHSLVPSVVVVVVVFILPLPFPPFLINRVGTSIAIVPTSYSARRQGQLKEDGIQRTSASSPSLLSHTLSYFIAHPTNNNSHPHISPNLPDHFRVLQLSALSQFFKKINTVCILDPSSSSSSPPNKRLLYPHMRDQK